MNRAPMFLAASSLIALAACGQGGEPLAPGAASEARAYETVQPEMAPADVDRVEVATTEPPPAPLPDALTGDIISIAQQAGDFTTFIAAIESVGLTETLEGPGPFTVFAPTDDAFAAMPEGALAELMRPANRDKLLGLLEYHVLPAHVTTGDVGKDMPSPATVQGDTLMLEAAADGTIKAGGASIVTADIVASNGVIHIVDKVMTPPEA